MARDGYWNISFWRDRPREVDFVVDVGGRLRLYEAKWTETPTARDAQQMTHLAETLGKGTVLSAGVVCRTATTYPMGEHIEALSPFAL